MGAATHAHALVLSGSCAAGALRTCSRPGAEGLRSMGVLPARHADVMMAVPKKRQSKMMPRKRKATWFAKGRRQAELAVSRAKSAKYDPFEDPKYSSGADDDDDDEDDE